MADIDINKSHSLDISDARERLEKMAGDLQARYGIKSAWTGQHSNPFRNRAEKRAG